MNESMLLIGNRLDHQSAWAPEQHQAFLKKCETYIGELKKDGKLISAQPLLREGKIIAGITGAWKELPFNEKEEVQI
jgi:hypothetical protein